MKHSFAIIKLLGVCAFLWLQAVQLDHSADQSIENPHSNCVVCKSVGDSVAPIDANLIDENIVYNSNNALHLRHLVPNNAPDRSLLTHGPPTLA